MNGRKLSVNKACLFLAVLLLVAMGTVSAALYGLTQNITAVWYVVLFGIFVLLCAVCFMVLVRRKLAMFSDSFCSLIDNMLSGNMQVFTKEVLSRVLQDELREVANKEVNDWFGEQIKEKSKGRNYDLTVAEYKVAQETEHLEQIQEQVNDADIKLFASQIAYKELERSQTKELNEKRSELQSVRQEIASVTDKANEAVELLDKINTFISSFRLFAPAIEEYANHVEADKTIEAGNSFRGILYEIGKLLETFKKLIKEGLCWFPRLMRWKTSKGEVAPVFIEKSNGYSYSVYGYMNVDTKEYYSKELMQREIKAGNRTGTVEQMDANVEAMARDLQEILRIGAEQKRLWEVYKGR